MAACSGFEFDPAVIAEAVGESLVPTLKRFASIEKKHRLVRASGRQLVFDHHQVQEALYGSLYEQMREAYHLALASTLETRAKCSDQDPATLDGALCVELCEHFLKGAQGELALRYLPGAHAHLTKGYLNDAAIRLAERALAVPGLLVGVDRVKALLRLSCANAPLDRLGRRKRQEEAAREADRLAEASDDPELCGQAKTSLGLLFFRTGRPAEAEAAYRAALETAKARGDKQGEAAAMGNLGILFRSKGRLAEAKEHHERHLALSREIGDREGEAAATGNLGSVFQSQGRLAEAKEQFERHLALSREIGHRLGQAVSQHNLGNLVRERGDAAGSEERYLTSLAVSEEIGHRHGVALNHLVLGSLRASLSGGESARASLTAARELAKAVGLAGVETLARCELSILPGGEPSDALSAISAHEERLDAGERLAARLLLWRATGDRTHLLAAKQLLDESVVNVDADTRASMLENLKLNRDIVAATKAQGI